jgi:hypothetical protein
MTVVADSKKRVTIRSVKPGERFDVHGAPPAKVRIAKRGDYTVGVLDRQINDQAIKEALSDFP